jgi:hypothetical protein
MAGNSADHKNGKDSKEGKPKRKTIKVEIPLPHVHLRSALRKGARSIRKSGRTLKKKLSVDEDDVKRPWNLPKHHNAAKTKHMHQAMSRRELFFGSILVAAVLIAIVMTRPGNFIVSDSPAGEDEPPFGWGTLPQIREKISFAGYIDNYLIYGDREIALTGFLKSELSEAPGEGMSVYKYYIVDDYGREIGLIELGVLPRSLFVKNATTEDLYNVTGIVKVRYAGFDLKVESVEKA